MEELAEILRNALDRFARDQDGEALFTPELTEAAECLRGLAVDREGQRFEATSVRLLTYFHFTRSAQRPGPPHEELSIALRLLTGDFLGSPLPVPPQFRTQLDSLLADANRYAQEGAALLRNSDESGAGADLDAAIFAHRTALNLLVTPTVDRALACGQLASALWRRFQSTESPGDLDEIIALRREARQRTPIDSPSRPLRLSLLVGALMEKLATAPYEDEPEGLLAEAIEAARESFDGTPQGTPYRALRAGRLGELLERRFWMNRSLTDLDEAVRLGMVAVEESAAESAADLGAAKGQLVKRLVVQADATGMMDGLDVAVATAREAEATASPEFRARRLSSLATALFNRHQRLGDLADLDEAILIERRVVELTPDDDDDLTDRRANLAASLRVHYQLTGALPHLEQSITVGSAAIERATPSRFFALSILSSSFQQRYLHFFEPGDLDRAVSLAEQAVAECPRSSRLRAMTVSGLMVALALKLRERPGAVDPRAVVELGREAVGAARPGDPDLGLHLSNLGNHLMGLFQDTGDLSALEEAEPSLRRASALIGHDHPFRDQVVTNLSRLLAARSRIQDDPALLDEAIATVRTLTRTRTASAPAWLQMGLLLETRHRRRDVQEDLSEAIECFRHAGLMEGASVTERLRACERWGSLSFARGDVDQSAEGYSVAVGLLPRLAWHGLSTDVRYRHLIEWQELASDAAAAMIAAGRPDRAIEVLEQGRAIIWNQTLRIRDELALLRESAPDLANRLREIATLLDAPSEYGDAPPVEPLEGRLVPSARERHARVRAGLAAQWDAVLLEVQSLPGLGGFLSSPPFEEIVQVGTAGPVVVVNFSRLACHALIIRDGRVEAIALTDIVYSETLELLTGYLNLMMRAQLVGRGFLDRERDRHELLDVLGWLWTAICRPVLRALSPERGSRVWWCPTGRLAILPLHAAGDHPRHNGRTGEALADHVVSSMTVTLTALQRARSRTPAAARLLSVGMPTTPGRARLPGVERELESVAARFPGTHQTLVGPDATRAAVKRELAQHPWVHFACHATQDSLNPESAAFALADGELSILDLAELQLPGADLACLSACETALGGVNLPDEAVHLAGALQLLWYRHVIACMWPISDAATADFTEPLYAGLCEPGPPRSDRAAFGLNAAVEQLRKRHPTDPWVWAPYVHFGM